MREIRIILYGGGVVRYPVHKSTCMCAYFNFINVHSTVKYGTRVPGTRYPIRTLIYYK